MVSDRMLEDLADQYFNSYLDGNIKTISYPPGLMESTSDSKRKISPMMSRMKEKMRQNKEAFDKTFSKANGKNVVMIFNKNAFQNLKPILLLISRRTIP